MTISIAQNPSASGPAETQPDQDTGAPFGALLRRWCEQPSKAPSLMGVVNVTPDSFSDGGQFADTESAADHGRRLVAEGAEILDIGGESTRPGGQRIGTQEELARVIPVLERLRGIDATLSVDTVKPRVAEQALASGAHIVNDVTGLQGDASMAKIAADAGAGVVIMHNPALFGSSEGTQGDPVSACKAFFHKSLEIAGDAGIRKDRIALDPGFGFGKSLEQNLQLLARLGELHEFRYPLLVGTSRKSFIGRLLNRGVDERLAGTLATSSAAIAAGAAILRVHDVAPHRDLVHMLSAIASSTANHGSADG